MLGLLYKDYIAVKGKYFLMALLGQLFLVTVLRLTTVDATMDKLLPLLVLMVLFVFSILIPFVFELSVMKVDEGRKQKQYFLSLPVSRRQYIASKYIFIAIAFYIIQSVATFEFVVCQVNMQSEEMKANMGSVQMLVPNFIAICMIICALDLPFFAAMGVKKGMVAKEGILFVAFLEKLGVMRLIAYFTNHPEIMLVVQVVTPLVSITLFYVSYLISARIFERKEWEDE